MIINKFKKIFMSIIVLVIVFSFVGTSNVHAFALEKKSSKYNVLYEKKEDESYYIHMTDSGIIESNYFPLIKYMKDGGIKLNSIGMPVSKPIRSQGKIYNVHLGTYINNIENAMNNMTIVTWLGGVLNPLTGSVAGGIATAASYLHNKYGIQRLNELKAAYNRGDHLYWVITSATKDGSGVAISRMETFSNLDLYFFHQ